MNRSRIMLLAVVLGTGACSALDKDPRAEVKAFSITPTTIRSQQSFEVRWDIEHSGAQGNVMTFTMSAPGPDGAPQKVFSRGDGTSRGRSRGSVTCKSGGSTGVLSCPPWGSGGSAKAGPATLTFEACDSYVLDPPDDKVCDQKTVEVVFED